MWQTEIRHEGLNKFRIVKGETREIMQLRADMQMRSWREQWERIRAARKKRETQLKVTYDKELNKKIALERSSEALRRLAF